MNAIKKIEYRLEPKESFDVLRNCSGCGCKTLFKNTGNFRVNANGSKIDVWLIYQCQDCKHTYNLTVYERQRPEAIPKEEYKQFLENAKEMAHKYGICADFFIKNKAEIDWKDMEYDIVEESTIGGEHADIVEHMENHLIIKNDCHLRLRADKVAAELLGVSRSQLKTLETSGSIQILEKKQEHMIEIVVSQ